MPREPFRGAGADRSGARVYDSTVRNYLLGDESLVERVTALECRRRSAFGNGTEVAAMNECAGRTVRIYDALTAQIAYLLAVYRHRPQTIAALERMIGAYVLERTSELGSVGRGACVKGARFVREVRIGDGATIDGATLLENGTLCAGAFVGADVKARDFILAEGARVDNGSILERCFVGRARCWTRASPPPIRFFSPTAIANAARPPRFSPGPIPFRTISPRC